MAEQSLSQDTPFSLKGYWWIPQSDCQVAGDLNYDGEDLSLFLYGGLTECVVNSNLGSTPISDQFPLIHGATLDGVSVTVCDCFHSEWKRKSLDILDSPGTRGELRYSTLNCGAAIIGDHLHDKHHLYSKCFFEVPGLELWIGDSPFDSSFVDIHQPITLSYKLPADREYRLRKEAIRFVTSVQLPSQPSYSPSFHHQTLLEVESLGEGQTFLEFYDLGTSVSQLLSVCYGFPIQPSATRLCDQNSTLFAQLFISRHRITVKDIAPGHFFVRYADVASTLGDVIEKWLHPSHTALRARRMLISSESQPSRFIDQRFLPLMQALEVFSNNTPNSAMMDKTQFRALMDEFRTFFGDRVKGELSSAIIMNLGHVNSGNLGRRIRMMIEGMNESTQHLFCKDVETFVKGLVKTRNQLTHYSGKPGEIVLQKRELHWAIRKLSVLLRLLLLLDAGIPEDVLRKSFQNNYLWKDYMKTWSTVSESGTPLEQL